MQKNLKLRILVLKEKHLFGLNMKIGRQFLNWGELRSQMIFRFCPSPELSMYEEFLPIKQKRSVREY